LDDDLYVALEPLGLVQKRMKALRGFAFAYNRDGANVFAETFGAAPICGLGVYGYRAVQCFGLAREAGLVDANIRRIFTRYFGLRRNCEANYNALAKALADGMAERSATINYALLDLAARFCLPRASDCGARPVRFGCATAAREKCATASLGE